MVFASESDVKEFNPGKQTYKYIYLLSYRLIFFEKKLNSVLMQDSLSTCKNFKHVNCSYLCHIVNFELTVLV